MTPPDFAGRRFSTMALVAEASDLDEAPPGEDTLVVVTEWLAWRRCLARGWAALHYEHALAPWPVDELGDPRDSYADGAAWAYDGDTDPSLFAGVSLGRLLATEMGLFLHACGRFRYGLTRLAERFGISSIQLHEMEDTFGLMPNSAKRLIVAEVAERLGLRMQERLASRPRGPEARHCRPVYRSGRESVPDWRQRLRTSYARVAGLVTGWRAGWKRPRILIWIGLDQLVPLINAFPGADYAPLILAGASPKDHRFLAQCWRRRVHLHDLPAPLLSASDRVALERMISGLKRRFHAEAGSWRERMIGVYLDSYILPARRLEDMAGRLRAVEQLFRRNRIVRVVVGDCDNFFSRLLGELAHRDGIAVDELLNGMFVTPLRNPTRQGDRLSPPMLTRLLAWGESQRRWLRAMGSPIDCRITGNPAITGMAPLRPMGCRRALLLPLGGYLSDPPALSGDIAAALVSCARVLENHGYEVRVKVHPGVHQTSYFEAVLRESGISAPLVTNGTVRDHLDWAELVVGPISSGAVVETVAAGKPFIALCPDPSMVDRSLITSMPVVGAASELERLLTEGWRPDFDAVMEELCSATSISDPALRFWAAMEEKDG